MNDQHLARPNYFMMELRGSLGFMSVLEVEGRDFFLSGTKRMVRCFHSHVFHLFNLVKYTTPS